MQSQIHLQKAKGDLEGAAAAEAELAQLEEKIQHDYQARTVNLGRLDQINERLRAAALAKSMAAPRGDQLASDPFQRRPTMPSMAVKSKPAAVPKSAETKKAAEPKKEAEQESVFPSRSLSSELKDAKPLPALAVFARPRLPSASDVAVAAGGGAADHDNPHAAIAEEGDDPFADFEVPS